MQNFVSSLFVLFKVFKIKNSLALGKRKTAELAKLARANVALYLNQTKRPPRLKLAPAWLMPLGVLAEKPPARKPAPAPARAAWLISQQDDLIYFIGSSAIGYAIILLLFKFKLKPAYVFWPYVILFDDPHIFATFSRTYADPQEWKRHRRLLLTSLLWFLPGPVAVKLRLNNYFDFFGYSWAYYHICKQHYGFSILYKKKNNDLAPLDNWLDKALVWSGFCYPFLAYVLGPNNPSPLQLKLPRFLPKLSGAVFGTIAALYGARQLYKLAHHQPLNWPKQLLLASALSLHNVALRLPYHRLNDRIYGHVSLAAIITIYHNVQYGRLLWFHNYNKYTKAPAPSATTPDYGLARQISKDWRLLLGLAVVLAAGWRLPLFALLRRLPTGQLSSGQTDKLQRLGLYIRAAGWGFAISHYSLDAKIWRVRRDPELNKALKFPPN